MHPFKHFFVPALLILNWRIKVVDALPTLPANAIVYRDGDLGLAKRQIRNADYALNAPPKPLDPASTHTNTNTTVTTSADPAKSSRTSDSQKRHLHNSDESLAKMLDSLKSYEYHPSPTSSDSAFWRRTTATKFSLLGRRNMPVPLAFGFHPRRLINRQNEGGATGIDLLKGDDFENSRNHGDHRNIALMEKHIASHRTSPFTSRRIFKHYSYPRISVVKHTLPPRWILAGTLSSPKSERETLGTQLHNRFQRLYSRS